LVTNEHSAEAPIYLAGVNVVVVKLANGTRVLAALFLHDAIGRKATDLELCKKDVIN